MNVFIDKELIKLVPENEEDRLLLHNAKYKMIKSLQLIDIHKQTEHLLISLGPGYINKQSFHQESVDRS